MSTIIKPELSDRNEHWIERHRYYELKHFCLQYPIWKKAYKAINELSQKSNYLSLGSKTNVISDPTSKCAEAKIFYSDRMKIIELTAKDTDSELFEYILKGVTEGRTYDYLKSSLDIPCCRDTYYKAYRKFFWMLNKSRN